MGRYAEGGRCLDCGAPLGAGTVCQSCGLVHVGPEAERLRELLAAADVALAAAERAVVLPPIAITPPAAGGVPTPAGPRAPAGWQPPSGWQPPAYPSSPRPDEAPARPRLPAVSTPVVLLGLGALCVLVAAVVFVSVAWSDLSLGAKAAILIAVTGTLGGIGGWSLRKGLRRSAESFSVLTTLLVSLDFVAAHEGGLVAGGLSTEAVSWVVVGLLLVVGVAWSEAARRSPAARLVGTQGIAAHGVAYAAVLALDEVAARDEYVALALVAAAAALVIGARARSLAVLAAGTAVIGALMFLYALAASLGAVLENDSWHDLWSTGEATGWAICTAVFAVLATWPKVPARVRRAAATAAVVASCVLVLRPVDGSSTEVALLAFAATTALLAAASLAAPDPWSWGTRLGALPASLAAAVWIAPAAAQALARVVVPLTDAWTYQPADLVDADLGFLPIATPWVVGVAAVLLAASGWVLAMRALPSREALLAIATAAGALTALVYPLYAGWVVVALLTGATVSGAAALATRGRTLAVTAALLGALALSAAAASELTTALTALLYTVVAGVAAVTLRSRPLSSGAAAAALLFAGLGLAAANQFTEYGPEGLALALSAVAAAALVSAQTTIGGSAIRQREGLEAGAAVLAVVGIALGHESGLALPIAMTLVGAAAVAVALLREDRRQLAPVGGLLLAAATWVRLNAVGVDVVEAYTLPSALVLLVLGWRRLRRVPDTTSAACLGPGLSLALVPSLLVALPDPTSPRALLLGIAALAVLLLGAAERLAAPLLVGGAVVATLAVVNLAPYADAIPRWVLFAAVGAALLFLGVTWERRLRDARSVTLALEALR